MTAAEVAVERPGRAIGQYRVSKSVQVVLTTDMTSS